MTARKKRSAPEVLDAIERAALDDEMERIRAASPEEIEDELRAEGVDPAQARADGLAFVQRLLAERDRLAWQIEADRGMAEEQRRLDAARGRFASLSREELLARLADLRRDAKIRGRAQDRVSVMFRNKSPEEATDLELREMLEEATLLAEKKPD